MPTEPSINDVPDDLFFSDTCLDEKSFQLLFIEYFGILCAYCHYQFSFDLELSKESVHSSFIKLWENRDSLSPGLPVKPYLYRIVQNTCIDTIRERDLKRRHEEFIMGNFSEADDEHNLNVTDMRGLNQAIDLAVSELPEKMKLIFKLSRYEGLKYTQIAEHLNLSVKTVETQISRAMRRLRQKLSEFYTIIFL